MGMCGKDIGHAWIFTMLAEIYKEDISHVPGRVSIRPGSGIIGIAQTFFPLGSAGWKLICVLLKEGTRGKFFCGCGRGI